MVRNPSTRSGGAGSPPGASNLSAAPVTAGVDTTGPAAGGSGGAQVHPTYHDRHEEYVLVTRDDLREIREFGWLERTLFGVGAFFFSGAFWLVIELLAHQERAEFNAWIGMCLLSMLFGVIIAGVGLRLLSLRQQRLDKYFPERQPDRSGPSGNRHLKN